MAITRSSAADRALDRGRHLSSPVTRNLEAWLLLAASAVIVAGLFLVYRAQAARWREPGSSEAPVLDLNRIQSAAELLPVLGFMDDPEDRGFASRRIFERLGAGPLESINELRAIRVTRDEIRSTRGLSRYDERLREASRGSRPAASLPLFTGPEMEQIRPRVAVRSPERFLRSLLVYSLLFFAVFYALHAAWRILSFAGDPVLLPLTHLLTGLGFILMVRLRDPLREGLLHPDFVIGAVLGAAAMLALSLPDYERTPLRRMAYVPLLASFLVSVILLIFGSGPGASDAKVNLRLGPLLVQPVEIVKILLVLFLAGYFAGRWEFFRELKEPSGRLPRVLRGLNLPRLQYALPVAVAVALATAFFFLQKDLGPALVLAAVFLTVYAVARARATGVLIGLGALIAAFWSGYALDFPRTVASRVSIWLSPWDNYVRGGGDHLAQSLWTFASGGAFGAGLGMGSPESLPAVHTDLILAAAGEDLGFAGLLAIYAVYALLLHRGLRIALAGAGYYSIFLGLGVTLLLGFQVVLISGGVLGLMPLSGVVTPFLNYGKSSALVHFAIVGILLAISARPGPPERGAPFRAPMKWVMGIFGVAAAAVLIQAARVQIFSSDRLMGSGSLVLQGDGHRRFTYNPRLLAAANTIPRGSIFDRNGIPLAVSSPGLLLQHRDEFKRLGVSLSGGEPAGAGRYYPFGALTFHILGHARTRINWAAPNTSFLERDLNATLQGYDDRQAVVGVSDRPGGPASPTLRRDLSELVPLVRYRHRPAHPKVQSILRRDRDVHATIDVRLQKAASELLERHVRAAKQSKGAAIILDAATGDLLASATYPWHGAAEAVHLVAMGENADIAGFEESLFDRPRYGLYPPGSSFKLVTAAAALQVRDSVESETFECRRLPDGRVGNYVRGWGRPVRDDVLDTAPHGVVNMARGIVVSCNAYFGQLGTYVVGPEALFQMAQNFGIRVASSNTPAGLRDALPQASYGQGQVVATPLQMARVAAAVCNGGIIHPVRWTLADDSKGRPVIPPEHARMLAEYMRGVVREGTARSIAGSTVPIAGKTGTAELRNRPSHAWFIGFAPYSGPAERKIAFAVIVENGRYGGRVAAPLAAELVSAAARLGIIDRE